MESLFEYERIIIFSESSLMMVVMLKKIIKISSFKVSSLNIGNIHT